VHAPTRALAIARMARALDELVIDGVETCVPFHARVMREPDFQAGSADVGYVDAHPELFEPQGGREDEVAAITAALLEEAHRQRHGSPRVATGGTGSAMTSWRRSGWPWGDGGPERLRPARGLRGLGRGDRLGPFGKVVHGSLGAQARIRISSTYTQSEPLP